MTTVEVKGRFVMRFPDFDTAVYYAGVWARLYGYENITLT